MSWRLLATISLLCGSALLTATSSARAEGTTFHDLQNAHEYATHATLIPPNGAQPGYVIVQHAIAQKGALGNDGLTIGHLPTDAHATVKLDGFQTSHDVGKGYTSTVTIYLLDSNARPLDLEAFAKGLDVRGAVVTVASTLPEQFAEPLHQATTQRGWPARTNWTPAFYSGYPKAGTVVTNLDRYSPRLHEPAQLPPPRVQRIWANPTPELVRTSVVTRFDSHAIPRAPVPSAPRTAPSAPPPPPSFAQSRAPTTFVPAPRAPSVSPPPRAPSPSR